MSWNKIEEHLFEKYCVEGEDKEFCKLMEEHDKEIRNKVIDEFAKKIKEATYQWFKTGTIAAGMIDEIAEQVKGGENELFNR